ncbi:MAG TPA: signal peptide peptidase SppA [Candidatus Limnocylindrales bacterium]|nr:signal peptide peptidase SppA [Candidatus Limnocylindrales bacterium]
MTWGQRRTLVILLVVAAAVLIFWLVPWWMISSGGTISSNSTLVLDLSGQIKEQRPADFSNVFFGSRALVLHEVTDAIDAARTDPKIKGLIVRIGPLDTGWAKLEEIHAHLLAFDASGKPSVCYLGYDGEGNPEYYAATGCDQIWLTPSNPLDVRGMMAQATFLRGTLDKLKIVPDFYHIAEFKTATNEFTEKKFTPAHREEVQSLLTSLYDQYVSEVSSARHINPAQFESLVEKGPFLPREALQNKLVDRLGYWDQVRTFFRRKTGEWNPVSFARYRQRLSDGSGPKIAIIYASGEIVSGESQVTPGGGVVMGGDSVAAELREARNDSSIKAIVLRVNSPGGSSVASEVIRREVQLAKQKKPVVASMSDVAASGGYWISMSANKIVADPDTITASIGVLSGKMNISGLYKLLGVSTDSVTTSDNATLYSSQQNFTPAQQQVIQRMLQDIYLHFTQGVAQGRHLPIDTVDKIAKGRVWSGEQAKALGLVDDLGGTDRAITIAKELAHIPTTESVAIVRMPKSKTLFDLLLDRTQGQVIARGNDYSSVQSLVHRLTAMVQAEPVRVQMPYVLTIR